MKYIYCYAYIDCQLVPVKSTIFVNLKQLQEYKEEYDFVEVH